MARVAAGSVGGLRVLERPLTLSNELRRQTDFTLEHDQEVRAHKRANRENLERGISRLAIAEEHGIATMLGTLRAIRFQPKRPQDVAELRQLIADIVAPHFEQIRQRAIWKVHRGRILYTPTLNDEERLTALEGLGPMPSLTDPWTVEAYRAIGELALITNFGIISARVITNNGVGFLVDTLQGTFEPEVIRYHGIGTTNTAENVADAALAAELSTVYNPDSTRAQGTLAEAAANIFRSVGTNSVDGAATIVEHGLFTQAATSGGVLWDRSVFAGIGLVGGNSLQTTYELTLAAGS